MQMCRESDQAAIQRRRWSMIRSVSLVLNGGGSRLTTWVLVYVWPNACIESIGVVLIQSDNRSVLIRIRHSIKRDVLLTRYQ